MSLFSALSISSSGMAAQRARAELLTENLANAETTRTPDGGPYRRKDVVFETQSFSSMMDAAGVNISEVVVDQRDPEQRYMPGHPDAAPTGYVAFPRVNPAEEMVDLMGASRNYEANVASMSVLKEMIQRSIDLLR